MFFHFLPLKQKYKHQNQSVPVPNAFIANRWFHSNIRYLLSSSADRISSAEDRLTLYFSEYFEKV